jgi:DnaK suppressor protein
MPSDASIDATTTDYRKLLLGDRTSLQAQLTELGFGGQGSGLQYDSNFADTSQVTAERGEAGALAGELRDALEEVEEALVRFDAGEYGNCEVCGRPISPARLEAMPAARTCIDDAGRR